MSKRDLLMEGVANVRESMGDFAAEAVRGAPAPGPRALPAHLQGVVRSKDVSQIEVGRIVRDPDQPREEFEPEALERLAQSLKTRGQLQPIRVRWDEGRGAYVVIVGERRWRAAQLAGLPSLACVVVDGPIDPDERLAIQLVENAIREDLKPIEQATAYRRLMDAKGWSARQLAGELAIHHANVLRALALLELPEPLQAKVEQGGIPATTAFELTRLDDPESQAAVAEAIEQGSLRRDEVRKVVDAVKAGRKAPAGKPEPVTVDLGSVQVTIRWKKADPMTAPQALRRALKALQDRDDQAA